MRETEEVRGAQDPNFVHRAFSNIAGRYVLVNHVLSLGIDVLWRKKVARIVRAHGAQNVLDLATGSGDLAETLQDSCPGISVTGIDFCLPMLRHARNRGLENLLVADAMHLPFPDNSQDGITIGFGLRNLGSWEDGLREMSRVLRPGGLLVVLDFSLPDQAWLRRPYTFYLSKVLPRVAGLLTGHRQAYEYLATSIDHFPSGEAMNSLIRSQGFKDTTCLPLSGGIASIYRAVVT